ncbi:hypothetical protein FA15DRAFT_697215 [Coprinopsis marcescibilis]|uniref:Uncharacterized protein n=1 Tax=Coprinopsis marcescibilis TaxID=230819 RepID=A0A5C3KJ65_COPMA|nr:hypothetical protein FA15DRAFT_697215 [Coprinopsis marcescibilis]
MLQAGLHLCHMEPAQCRGSVVSDIHLHVNNPSPPRQPTAKSSIRKQNLTDHLSRPKWERTKYLINVLITVGPDIEYGFGLQWPNFTWESRSCADVKLQVVASTFPSIASLVFICCCPSRRFRIFQALPIASSMASY